MEADTTFLLNYERIIRKLAELERFKEEIQKGNTYVVRNGYLGYDINDDDEKYFKFTTTDESLKLSEQANKNLQQVIKQIHKDNYNKINSLKKMSIFEFLKWRKTLCS